MDAESKKLPDLEQMPAVPSGATFRLGKIERVSMPHPYCITPKHVEVASDHFGGMLGQAAIEDAEKRGAKCDICRKAVRKGGQAQVLSYAEHETLTTLFIVVPQNRDLNAIPGLVAYLNAVKTANVGIEGFAFPKEG